MNSNLNRALTAALVAFGGVAPAVAQIVPVYDNDQVCVDPNNSNPYSNPFGSGRQVNVLFGAGIGVTGTVTYGTQCDGASPITGRIGFTIGTRGSIQDDVQSFIDPYSDPNQPYRLRDDNLRLTLGASFAEEILTGDEAQGRSYIGPFDSVASGGNSYARIYQTTTTGTPTTTSYLYGGSAFTLAYFPRSGRSYYTEGTVNAGAIGVRCVIDVLADAARVSWTLTNNSTATLGLGLYFGQVVALYDGNGIPHLVDYGQGSNGFSTDYITIPGRRPLSVDERFPGDVTATVPPYVNFSLSQNAGFGLQVVNDPSALSVFTSGDLNAVSDQTPVDEFEIGKAQTGFLVDGHYNTADPQFVDGLINPPGNGNADSSALGGYHGFPGYVQRWEPTDASGLTAVGGSRSIIAYYRATNFDSSYSPQYNGYSAAIDTPKALVTGASTGGSSSTLTPNPFKIRVNVDNTGGFSLTDSFVSMQSVSVQLTLPQGMHAVGSTDRVITQKIDHLYAEFSRQDADDSLSQVIPSGAIGYTDFTVQVDSTVSGAQSYTAVITPQPGFLQKTITGTINVAATPVLQVQSGANLVGSPWQYSDNNWETVLGLTLNRDFQAYTWDSTLQQYVPQPAAERGIGTWVVSATDHNFVPLGGAPSQPGDQFPTAANYDNGGLDVPVSLHRGWNLVANPYNFAFPIGQIVGIPANGQQALQFTDLVSQNYFDGSFAYYDPTQRRYLFVTGDATTQLQPNIGYWVYANFDFQLQFPPIYQLFVRSAAPTPFKQRFDNWKLQMSASVPNSTDSETYMGIVRNVSDATKLSVRKAPMPPPQSKLDTLRATVAGTGNVEMAQTMRYARGAQSYTYNVYSKTASPVTISWPNLKALPSNLAVTVTDTLTRQTVNARSASSYSFSAGAQTIRPFTVKITPQGTVAQRVSSASTTILKKGNVKLMQIAYLVSGRGGATLNVYRGSKLVGNVATDTDVVAGTNTLLWSMTDLQGAQLPNGSYTLQIAATGEGGDTSTKSFAISISR